MVSVELENFTSRKMTGLKKTTKQKNQHTKTPPHTTKQNKKTQQLDETAHSTSVSQLCMHCEPKGVYRPIINIL